MRGEWAFETALSPSDVWELSGLTLVRRNEVAFSLLFALDEAACAAAHGVIANRMPASLRANATAAIRLPRRAAMRSAHADSASV